MKKSVIGKVKKIIIDFPMIKVMLEEFPVPFECFDPTLIRDAEKIRIGNRVKIDFEGGFVELSDITAGKIDVIIFQQILKI